MDMLDFESGDLYFDQPLADEVKALLDEAAENYGDDSAELALLRAYFLEPEHPMVLVGLYRYFYYQHRLDRALIVADRVLALSAVRLGLPDWQWLNAEAIAQAAKRSMTEVRFYLLALKGAGFLQLRLGEHEAALARLEKVAALDSEDRLGAGALIDVARAALVEPT